MNKVFNLIIIFVLVIACGCSVIQRKPKNPDGTVKDTSELWSKSQAMQDIIKRSGTPFKGEAARESGLTERDAFNRLHSGGGLFGKKGLSLDMGENNQTQQTAAVGIPINPYLWRASLESISFMPLSSADPFAGTIITEWYNDQSNSNERCKVNIFIKGVELKTNNLKASIFCQEKISNNWVDSKVDIEQNLSFENVILEKAKKLRLSNQ